jgi:hypothetical protein
MASAGCAGMNDPGAGAKPAAAEAKAGPQMMECVAPDKLSTQVAPEAQLESFQCYLGDFQKTPSLHFKIALKNTTSQPQRYRVNIFLDNGKAVGGLIPPVVKKGLVDPGKSVSFVYPVKGLTEKPAEINLIVKTVSE